MKHNNEIFNLFYPLMARKYDYLDKSYNIANIVFYMLNRSNMMFAYKNLPDTIPAQQLEKLLQINGFCIIGKINNELYAVNAGLGGELDVYYQPTRAVVAVPFFNFNAEWEIGKDCVLGKNDLMCVGLMPVFNKYASLINETEVSLMLESINTRMQQLISAQDTSTIESAQKYLKNVVEGKIGVITETPFFEGLKVNPASAHNSKIKDLFELHNYLKSNLFAEIGLSSNNNMKRERLVTAEVQADSETLYPLTDDMLRQRRIFCDEINKMFNTNITVDYNSIWDEDNMNFIEALKANVEAQNNNRFMNVATEEAAQEEVATEEAAQEEVATEEAVEDEVATEEATQEEVATEEVATEEAVEDEVATEEATQEEVATEEAAQEEVATEEAAQDDVTTKEEVVEEKVEQIVAEIIEKIENEAI